MPISVICVPFLFEPQNPCSLIKGEKAAIFSPLLPTVGKGVGGVGACSPYFCATAKKELNHVNHANQRHLRAISFRATESVLTHE